MTCKKCKEKFNPREVGPTVEHGYSETTEINVTCPHCDARYAKWIGPEEWDLDE